MSAREPYAANEFGSGLGPSAGGEPEVSGLPVTGTSAANLHRCKNPLCERLTTALYCCGPCANAHERRYEIHEAGPLAHTESCNERHRERSGDGIP